MKVQKKRDLATLTKVDAACNTILSLLFVVLMVLFTVFVMDLLGVIHLSKLITFVNKGQDDVKTNMPFIISTVQEELNKNESETIVDTPAVLPQQGISFLDVNDNALVGQSRAKVEVIDVEVPEASPLEDIEMVETVHKVNKPAIDKNEYRNFQLDNHLKVLLIRDPKATMASASMNVQVGSWHEPEDYPGLAHFCEHMLFQGSETFPEIGQFDNLVSGTGGYSNAYTEATNTNYYFEVGSGQLVNALDIFSHFFVDPLFSRDAVDKEINAINSEYEIDTNGDSWKIMNLFTLLSAEDHPASRFTIGNTETLSQSDIVHQLRKFHREFYSSNLMTLAIRSNLDLMKLEGWIRQKSDFTKIPNNNVKLPEFKGKPIQSNLASIVKYQVDSSSKSIILNYQLSGKRDYFHTKPVEFIDSFITSSHENGLRDYLKGKGFIADLEAFVFLENTDYSNYMINMALLQDPEYKVDQRQLAYRLAKVTNTYLQFLRDEFFTKDGEATQLLRDYYDEQAKLSKVNFKYMDDGQGTVLNDISFISKSLGLYPADEVLSGNFLMTKANYEVIKQFLDEMINAYNMMILVGDSSYEAGITIHTGEEKPAAEAPDSAQGSDPVDLSFIVDPQLDQHSELYRLDYALKKLSEKTIKFIQQKDSKLSKGFELPRKNTYIPDDSLSLKKTCQNNDGSGFTVQLQLPMTDPEEADPYTNQAEARPVKVNALEGFRGLELIALEDDTAEMQDPEARLNSFVGSGAQQDSFKSAKECMKKELAYEKKALFPQLLEKTSTTQLWAKLDRSFDLPAVYSAVRIETAPIASAKDQTLMMLLSQQLSDKFREELNEALNAGYALDLSVGRNGLNIQMYGFSNKIKEFFFKVVNCPCLNPNAKKQNYQSSFLQLTSDPDAMRFKRVKDSLNQALRNSFERKLYEQATHLYLPMITTHPFYTPQEQVNVLNDLSYSDLKEFQRKIMRQSKLTGLFVGNILKDETLELGEVLKSYNPMGSKSFKSAKTQTINLRGKNVIFALSSLSADESDPNAVTLNYYQIGRRNKKNYAIMQLLQGMFNARAYEKLRTEEQLGYVVAAGFKPLGCIDGAVILIEGSAEYPYVNNKLIEDFVMSFGHEIEDMTNNELDQLKEAVIETLKEDVRSLQNEGDMFWEHILNDDLAFEERQVAAATIRHLKKDDVVSFYNNVFLDSERGKLSVQLYGKGMKANIEAGGVPLQEFLADKALNVDQSAAGQQETIVFSSGEFAKMVETAYSCDYDITGF